jgi:hypothetical protein
MVRRRGNGQELARLDGRKSIMKKLTISILIALVATAGAQTLRAPIVSKKHAKRPAPAPPVYRENVSGVLPRAFQNGGNPLQMLNPKAPAKYGTAEQSVVFDPETGKWKGIKLFTINF